jgi:hypothetical protein
MNVINVNKPNANAIKKYANHARNRAVENVVLRSENLNVHVKKNTL